jgi:hypothetical protein
MAAALERVAVFGRLLPQVEFSFEFLDAPLVLALEHVHHVETAQEPECVSNPP